MANKQYEGQEAEAIKVQKPEESKESETYYAIAKRIASNF